MSTSRWERFAPLTGVIFFALILIVFILDNNTPNADASTADAVSYWTTHNSRAVAAGLVGAFAVIFLLWFAGSLRSALRRAEGGEGRLSTLAFAGLIVVATAGAIGANLDFVLGDIADDLHAGHADVAIQTLSALNSDFFFPFVAGFAVTMFASGLCALRFGALPKWLGWASIVIGIALVTPAGFLGFLAALVWILVVSVVLYLRGAEAATPQAAPPPAGPAT
jgi:hypothetical protein